MLPSDEGNVPVNRFVAKFSVIKFDRLAKVDGNGPDILTFDCS